MMCSNNLDAKTNGWVGREAEELKGFSILSIKTIAKDFRKAGKDYKYY